MDTRTVDTCLSSTTENPATPADCSCTGGDLLNIGGNQTSSSKRLLQDKRTTILRQTHVEMRSFLNRLHSFVYVISDTGYQVLYANDAMLQRAPALLPGTVCYRVLWGRDEPCLFCPLESMTDMPFNKTLLYNTPFGPAMDLSVSRTLWSNEEPAFLMLMSEHFLSSREQEYEAKRNAVAQALSMSYDTVIDIDPKTGRYEFLSISDPERVPHYGDYETEISNMYRDYAASEDQELVIKTFSLAHMLEVFDSGVREISLDFQWKTPEGSCWKHRRVVPYTQTDGSRHILGYSHDVTRQKQLEEHRLQTERAYRYALQASYTEIYEVDPYADTYRCIQNNTNPKECIVLSGNLREDVLFIVRTRINIEDQAAFLAHFNNDAIIDLLTCDTETERTRLTAFRAFRRDGSARWFSSRMLPLIGESNRSEDVHGNTQKHTKVLVLIRDITEQKSQEEQQRIATQYDRALRNIYDEMYELNVTKDSYRILYCAENKFVTPVKEGCLTDGLLFTSHSLIHAQDRLRFLQFCNIERIRKIFTTGREFVLGEFRKLWKNEEYHWVSLTMFPMPPSENNDEVYLVFVFDINERKQSEEIAQQNILLERQRIADERYKIIVEQTNTLVFEWYKNTDSRYYCPEMSSRFAGNYALDRNIRDIWQEDNVVYRDDLPIVDEFFQTIESGSSHAEMRCRLHRINGQYIWCKVSISALRGEDGEITRIIGTINDVDEAMRSINTLKFQAKYDMLTNILNAQAFYTAAARIVDNSPEKKYRIVRMDIERFKIVNDLYGLKEGDRLLRAIAGIIAGKVGNHGICGRIGGDIFCMCVDFSEDQIIERIQEIRAKLSYYPLPYRITPAFGICAVENSNTPISVLCDWANIALKTVKGSSIKWYAFYNDTLRSKIFQEKKIESEMHGALLDEQFIMYLQPKVSIATSEIIGAEALVRWQHPTEGLILPDTFVPLFEKNGFIVRLDEYIWEQACIAIRRWLDKGYTVGSISVNVSRMHFHESGFWKKLVALVKKYDVPPRLLELELTETVFLENANQLGESMRALQEYGFPLSMDDFGSGYSSLTMLKNLPIDIIKIDRSFLQEGVSTVQGRIIIRHILSMAKQMRLQSIAEGVETVDQARFLLDSGCTTAQGFYYSCAVPLAEFEKLAFETTETIQPPTEKSPLAGRLL